MNLRQDCGCMSDDNSNEPMKFILNQINYFSSMV